MNLNAEQIQAINFGEGAVNVLSTAGSGKTTVICKRVERLFKEGATPDNLLVLTFTREAAENLERRLGVKIAKDRPGGFRTFHSFCLNLVRHEAKYLPYGLSSEPFPEGHALSKLLLTAMKENGIRRKQFEEVRAYISKKKRERVPPFDCVDDAIFAKIYSQYEQALTHGGMLDFDSMIVEAVNILEKHPEVRDRWQFLWVHCDEAQDTDSLQFRLLQLISEKHKNVFVVGDFNQCIYSFRGSHPENLVEFQNWFPGAQTILLPENFRSTETIVAYGKKHAPLKNDLAASMRTRNSLGVPIEYRMYPGPTEEAESTLSEAIKDPANSAILARTNNQIGVYESLALQHNIKFNLLGQSGLWNKSEVNNLVNFAAFCSQDNQPKKSSEEQLLPYRRRIRNLPATEALEEIMRVLNLESWYANDDYTNDENFAISNLRTVVDISKRFRTLNEFLNHARRASHVRKHKKAVTFGTIHAAKGLEFDNVFVIGVQERKLPHERGDFEEELRLFYVSISRPAKRLRISFAGTPSQFIVDELTPEIRAELHKNAQTVERINRQQELFAK